MEKMRSFEIGIQPVANVEWIHRDNLSPNLYNPNIVAPPEMDLLQQSILEDGWLFPLVVFKKGTHIPGLTDENDKDKNVIVDGFHRYTISGRKEVYALTDGYVPCVIISPANPLATTVRMNRAKGTHAVLKMSDIIARAIQDGTPLEGIMQAFGMEKEEVVRLANRSGIHQSEIVTNSEFTKSWTPKSLEK